MCEVETRETEESAKKKAALFELLSQSANALGRLFALRRGESVQDSGDGIFGRTQRQFGPRTLTYTLEADAPTTESPGCEFIAPSCAGP